MDLPPDAWDRIHENIAAARAAARAEVITRAEWNEWGTTFKRATRGVAQTSLFWNHFSEWNDAFCCLNAEVLSPNRQERRISRIFGDADTTLKFDIAGGKSFLAIMTVMILTTFRLRLSTFSPQTHT